MTKLQLVVGLEMHCELKSNAKVFSTGINKYSDTANCHVSPVDMAFPGTLPIVNKKCIEHAIKMASVLNCTLADKFIFDRKNYYYPDLPKGYQITQCTKPIGVNGYIDLPCQDRVIRAEIHDIHLEEDAASLDHFKNTSTIDYNRAGVPLLEIVTEPCFYSADEAVAFLEYMRNVYQYTDISLADTKKGQIRCDVNVNLKNEKGEYEYDIPEAIDIDLFNEKLDALLKGEETTLPTYNFLTGEKEYKHPPVSLKNRDLLIVEGIHTLNELLTSKIPRENKLKIYISPFTPLGLDRHNHVSTVDLRLIRRIVRDARTRGYNAVDTLKSWRNVRISEEKYIFPYQKEADIVLNTALIYELGILKTFAVPLLYNVNYKSEYYTEAKRIINFLKIFLNIPESALPETALLREFVGGGYFE